MPSRAPVRKRKRRPVVVPWTPLLWGAVVGNVAVGAMLSPLTVGRSIRVVGVPPEDQSRVSQILDLVDGIPAMQISTSKIESKVDDSNRYLSISYTQNIFGRGVLKAEPLTPVAKLGSDEGVYLSITGRAFMAPISELALPKVTLPESAQDANLSLTGTWQAKELAKLVGRLSGLYESTFELEATPRGVLLVKADDLAVVEFGSVEDLDKKVEKFGEMLQLDKGLLTENRRVNLTSVSAPMVEKR